MGPCGISFIVLLPLAASLGGVTPGIAQELARPLAGVWDAQLTVDSAHAVPHDIGVTHVVMQFGSGPYCGGATLAYTSTSGPSDTTHVTYAVIGDTLTFGGRVTQTRVDDSVAGERCRVSADDGSLFGRGIIRGDSIVGRWGRASFGSNGPIGKFVLRLREASSGLGRVP